MLFFFSYARADSTAYLEKFYKDLREEVRSKAGEPDSDRISFRDLASIEPGKPWSDTIIHALRACKVFVYLHTPTYFTRDGCGREFRVIINRIAASGRPMADLAQASCIQPVYWQSPMQLNTTPLEIARIQLTHEDYGEAYGRDGMLHITRTSWGTRDYWDAVKGISERIHTAARNSPLPELESLPNWDSIPPLFPAPVDAEPLELADNPIRPPRFARFIWVVARRNELAQTRNVECLESYDPYGIPEEWRPFLPDCADPARLIAIDAAREARLGYLSEALPPTQEELQSLIRHAAETYTPVIVVSDLWSLRLRTYRAVVRVFDLGRLDNCAVVFPWNLTDPDTNRYRADLQKMLAEIFPLQFHRAEPSLLFDGISDVHTFKAEISKLLTKYIADVSRGMTAARRLPEASPFNAPPQLGPTAASP
jgi:FxsC-like protein